MGIYSVPHSPSKSLSALTAMMMKGFATESMRGEYHVAGSNLGNSLVLDQRSRNV